MTQPTSAQSQAYVAGLRHLLCRAVYDANGARLERDRRAGFAEAFALARALRFALQTFDQAGPGIVPPPGEVGLPSGAEKITRNWLSADADRLLGVER